MVINYLFGVIHAAVNYFYGVSVEDFSELVIFRKCLSIRARDLYPMLVLVFLLNGGLYQMMLLRCLFFRLFVVGGSYCSV